MRNLSNYTNLNASELKRIQTLVLINDVSTRVNHVSLVVELVVDLVARVHVGRQTFSLTKSEVH